MSARRRFTWKLLAIGLTLAGLPTEVAAKDQRCDSCALPELERELAEQQWLRDKYREYTRKSKYQLIASDATKLAEQVTEAFNKRFGAGDAGGGASYGKPAMGVRWWTKKCDIVVFIKDEKGDNVKDKDGNPTVEKFDPKTLRSLFCKEIREYMTKHEEHHRDQCLARWGGGGAPDDWDKVELRAAEEVAAHDAGINMLKEAILEARKKAGKPRRETDPCP